MVLRALAWEAESIRHREEEADLSGMLAQGCGAGMGLPPRAVLVGSTVGLWFLCVCALVQVCHHPSMEGRGHLEGILSSHRTAPRGQTRVIHLGKELLYPLSFLTNHHFFPLLFYFCAMFSLVFCCYDKTPGPKTNRRGRNLLPLPIPRPSITERSQGRLKQRP